MKQSAIAKKRAKHHKRLGSAAKLNLVSLMDIFTILVFFLIVNQSEVTVLETANKISLPKSVAEELPKENVLITVLNNNVLVQGVSVWHQEPELKGTSLVDNTNEALISAIKNELAYLTSKRPNLTISEQELGRSITIMGDANVPYQVLKKIMSACADSNYRNISLAVKHLLKNTSGEGE